MSGLDAKISQSLKKDGDDDGSQKVGEFELLNITYEQGWTKSLHKKTITSMAMNNSFDVLATSSEDNYIRFFNVLM